MMYIYPADTCMKGSTEYFTLKCDYLTGAIIESQFSDSACSMPLAVTDYDNTCMATTSSEFTEISNALNLSQISTFPTSLRSSKAVFATDTSSQFLYNYVSFSCPVPIQDDDSSKSSSSSASSSLSTAAIAGIAVGSIAAISAAAAGVYFFYFKGSTGVASMGRPSAPGSFAKSASKSATDDSMSNPLYSGGGQQLLTRL